MLRTIARPRRRRSPRRLRQRARWRRRPPSPTSRPPASCAPSSTTAIPILANKDAATGAAVRGVRGPGARAGPAPGRRGRAGHRHFRRASRSRCSPRGAWTWASSPSTRRAPPPRPSPGPTCRSRARTSCATTLPSGPTRKWTARASAWRWATRAPTTSTSRRNLKKAKIERAPTSPAVVDYFLANKLDVAAGVKQQLEMDAKRLPGLRLLPGRFMVINQAMGMTRGKEAGAKYLTAFVEEMKASGFVAEALQAPQDRRRWRSPLPAERLEPGARRAAGARSCTAARRRPWARCTPARPSSRWCPYAVLRGRERLRRPREPARRAHEGHAGRRRASRSS